MCLIKGAIVGKSNFDVIKMHGTKIKKQKNKNICTITRCHQQKQLKIKE